MFNKRFTIPKTGYLYIIERNGVPVTGAKYEIRVENVTYDVVPAHKEISLERMSDCVYNIDNKVLDKVHPGRYEMFANALNHQLGVQVNELIFG